MYRATEEHFVVHLECLGKIDKLSQIPGKVQWALDNCTKTLFVKLTCFTVKSCVTINTIALVPVHVVNACSVVLAWNTRTFFDIYKIIFQNLTIQIYCNILLSYVFHVGYKLISRSKPIPVAYIYEYANFFMTLTLHSNMWLL